MNVFTGETHERYAAEFCLRVAFKSLRNDDIDSALKRTEDALRSLKELKKLTKKAN